MRTLLVPFAIPWLKSRTAARVALRLHAQTIMIPDANVWPAPLRASSFHAICELGIVPVPLPGHAQIFTILATAAIA